MKIQIDGWKQNITFSSAHILPGHEKCGRMHGHTYAISVRVYGGINKNGIIMDFSFLKTVLRDIAEKLNHMVLIPEKNPAVVAEETEIKLSIDDKKYVFPKEDCLLLPIKAITSENLAEYVLKILIQKIKPNKNIQKIEIGIDEGFGQGAKVEKIVG